MDKTEQPRDLETLSKKFIFCKFDYSRLNPKAKEMMEGIETLNNSYHKDIVSFLDKTYAKTKRKQSVILESDINITHTDNHYILNILDHSLQLSYNIKSFSDDADDWRILHNNVHTFIKTVTIHHLLFLQQEQIKNLKKKLDASKRATKLGVTKKPTMMIRAESNTYHDLPDDSPIFDLLKEEGAFEETKAACENRNLAHLNNQSGFIFDAILSYIKDYRHNQKSGIIEKIEIKNPDTGKVYEEQLRISDTWINFCARAGATTKARKADLYSDVRRETFKFDSLGIRVDRATKKEYLSLSKNFIAFSWELNKSKTAKNLKNMITDNQKSKIIIYVKMNHLGSIIKKNITGEGTTGFQYFPERLQASLLDVFDNDNTRQELTDFCEKSLFKYVKGKGWSNGIRQVFSMIAYDTYGYNITTTHIRNGEKCHLLLLDKDNISRYAKLAYPRSVIKKTGKVEIPKAMEYILMALKAIQLSNELGLNYYKVIDFESVGKNIHIYIKLQDKRELGRQEQIVSFN